MRACSCLRLMLVLGLTGLGACSDDSDRPPREAGVDGPRGDGLPVQSLKWTKTVVDPDNGGKSNSIASIPGKIAIAYIREIEDQIEVTCPATIPGQPATQKQRDAQDVMYVENVGTGWGTPVQVERTVGDPAGVSVALDKQGKAFVGYLGGEVGITTCSSSDAIIASAADGKSFSKRTVLGAGPVGDTVGFWMSVAIDSKGADHAAFADVRFSYYEVEGQQKASARYDAADIIAKENGAGIYNDLLFDAQDRPIVAFFNPMQKGLPAGGIQLGIKNGTSWETQQLMGGSTKERISLALSPLGNLGLSYYDPTKQQMKFLESDATDYKKTWTEQLVDNDSAHAGEFSSLAYDSRGNPAVSYSKCGAYGTDTCDPGKDALRFAWRVNGVWKVYDVDTGDSNLCGTYSSLTFVDDLPVIAYRCVALNSTTKEFLGSLKVARGAMQ